MAMVIERQKKELLLAKVQKEKACDCTVCTAHSNVDEHATLRDALEIVSKLPKYAFLHILLLRF